MVGMGLKKSREEVMKEHERWVKELEEYSIKTFHVPFPHNNKPEHKQEYKLTLKERIIVNLIMWPIIFSLGYLIAYGFRMLVDWISGI